MNTGSNNAPGGNPVAPGTGRHDRVIPVAGDGLVARWPVGTVVVGGNEATRAAALAALAPGGAPPSADELVDRLRGVATAHLAAVVTVPGGRRAICRGAGAVVELEGDRTTISQAEDAAGDDGPIGHDSEASAPDGPFWVGFGPIPFDHETIRVGPVDLGAGVVPGRGALVEPSPTEPAPAPPAIAPTDAPPRVFDVADLRPQAPRRPLPVTPRPAPPTVPPTTTPPTPATATPTPTATPAAGAPAPTPAVEPAAPVDPGRVVVKGIECSRGHFNNPNAAYCSQCGISLVHLTHRLVDGVRPALGFLVFDDGTTFTLDRSYLIGREPEPDDGTLTPLVATDAEHTVSRSHAELVLDDWEVSLCDLGSTNGTFVWRDDQQRWEPVLPNRPVAITAGTRVAVGRRTFVYEALGRSA